MTDWANPQWLIDDTQDLQPIERALYIAQRCGGVDGAHHKDWVIDQMCRALLVNNDEYSEFVREACDGEDGPGTYTWNEGVAP